MRFSAAAILACLPCAGQFRHIEIAFQGVGCSTCVDSLPARVQRMRGVESAAVDAARGVLTVRLTNENRVRLEQVRDLVEQDGTKATRATVQVAGELSEADGKLTLRPAGVKSTYRVIYPKPVAPGAHVVAGEVDDLKPASGEIAIRAVELAKAR